MDFNAMGFASCQGVWAADSVSSDYETWSPSDGASSENCLLGQHVTYTRRKRTSQCWNGEKFERPTVSKKCACTQEDFACDIGFVRNVGSKDCIYGGVDMMPERFVPTLCSRTFDANAYRLVPGDQCEGGWQPVAVEVPCPSNGMVTGSIKSVLFIALCVGVAYVAFGQLCIGSSPPRGFEFKASSSSWFSDISPMTALQFPLVACSWLYSKISSNNRGFDSHPTLGYQKVNKDDFDFAAIGAETSLNDFIDQAEYDDSARVYDGAAADDRPERGSTGRVSGGLSSAAQSVPRLRAPASGSQSAAQTFDMLTDDADLL
mmetsp:Transcript_101552/g.292575  ORF Transcript_101552/g.292575 Transcript_101552/m.292575 type:complete len:318 (+) Transcript_101552:1-954(+)